MARPLFLPSRNAYTTDADGRPCAGIPVRLFTRQVGGTQVTDLVYVGYDGTLGSAVPNGVLVSDGNGLVPAFAGPDGGPTTLWADSGMTGERLALTPGAGGGGSLTGTGGGAVTTTAQVAADSALSGTYALADPTITLAYAGSANPTLPTTVTENGTSTTFTYSQDGLGTPLTRTRLGVTRTFSYTSGKLIGVA